MCLGIPGKIVGIVDDANSIAKVDVSGVKRNVNTHGTVIKTAPIQSKKKVPSIDSCFRAVSAL